ncbi:putative MFS transporter [Xylariales sp. PMI_506]|nr:putative MFS transporter [Xylariales sp. PMI_506]
MANTNVNSATASHNAGIDEKSYADSSLNLELIGDEARPIDPEVERRVLRKIDLFLMPAMVIGYGLVYYDKAILGSAALFGMTTDLQLSVGTDTSRLSWATSIFYFGQLIGSFPMTYLLQHFERRWVLGPSVLVWSIICAATAGVTTWQGLLVQRFFLGFTESIIPTSFMVTVSGYYTQSDQALRQSWWFSGTGWFTVIGSALNYGFAHIEGGALKSWQYIYVFAGCLTFLFGLWCFFIPNSPLNAWFLTPEERVVAVERLRLGQTGLRNQTIKLDQVKEGLLDIKVWLVALTMASAYTVNGAVSGFGPLIVSTFGYSSLESILFQFPLGAVCAIGIPLTGWLSSRFRNIRIPLLVLCCFPVIAGFVMIWKSTWSYHPIIPVAGYSMIGFFGPVVSLTVGLGASNVTGETKKSFMAAAVFVAYCVGNIVGPQLVRSQTKTQHYPELWTGLIICYCFTILFASSLYVILRRENNKRDKLGLNESERERSAFKDLTDKQNLYFRYVL